MSTNSITPDDTNHAVKTIHRSTQDNLHALRQIVQLLRASGAELSVGGAIIDRELQNHPVAGLTRHVLSNRRVSGTDSFNAAATKALEVVPESPGRLGGTICNSGTGSAILYLVKAIHLSGSTLGFPALFLAASGGSWDFRLGNVTWDGAVSVISTAGTTLTVAQF